MTKPLSKSSVISRIIAYHIREELEELHVNNISDQEMRKLMLSIEDRLYSVFYGMQQKKILKINSLNNLYQKLEKELFGPMGVSWDAPYKERKK